MGGSGDNAVGGGVGNRVGSGVGRSDGFLVGLGFELSKVGTRDGTGTVVGVGTETGIVVGTLSNKFVGSWSFEGCNVGLFVGSSVKVGAEVEGETLGTKLGVDDAASADS